jgi:hypothetical protein
LTWKQTFQTVVTPVRKDEELSQQLSNFLQFDKGVTETSSFTN